MKIMEYKGYSGSADIDYETGVITGKILFVNDLVTFQTTDGTKVKTEFEAAVDAYIETCEALNREPQKPSNGAFNVRVTSQLHKAAAVPMTQIMVRQIFEQWATDHRANPGDFYTAEEVAAMEVGTLAVKQAIHFMALHRQLQAQPQA